MSTPPPCEREIFETGTGVCMFHARAFIVEPWVVAVREKSEQRVDWHYVGGRAVVRCLGDVARVRAAITELRPNLDAACIAYSGRGAEVFTMLEDG